MQLISALDPAAYTAIQDVALKFGFPAILVLLILGAVFYALWQIGGKILEVTIKTMDKISLSNEKNAEATEKIAQLIDVMTDQNTIIDKRLSSIESASKKQLMVLRKSIIALKELIPKEKAHIKDLLDEILREVNDK